MGMRTSIKVRRNRRRIDQPKTQATNHALKTAERARREVRMMEKLRAGSLPYTPAVMSWLSVKLDKKASHINEADIKTVIG
jgi:hypothetical protein